MPIRHPGSKARMMARIVPLLPDHEHFVSVFGGSGAEILRKPVSKVETFNDLNGDIVNLFDVLRDARSRRDICRRLAYTPHSRTLFESCVDRLRRGTDDPIDRAWTFLVVANQARAGTDATIIHPSCWGYRRKFNRRDRWPLLPEFVEEVGRRFREVQIENASWEKIIPRYDSFSTVHMVDPPYLPEVRVSKCLYKHELSAADHKRLLDFVQQVKGYVVLCGYDSDLYRSRLSGWRSIRFPTRCTIAPGAAKPQRTEVVWLNFDPDAQPRFVP